MAIDVPYERGGPPTDSPSGAVDPGGLPHHSRQERLLASPVLYRTGASAAGAAAMASAMAVPAVDRVEVDSATAGG